jgi:CubicO group peptidase (beta-lactamase class C family)
MREGNLRAVALALVAAAFTTAAARAVAASDDLEADVRRIVEEERARWGTPGMTVAVIRDWSSCSPPAWPTARPARR